MQERAAIVRLQQGDINGLEPLVREYQLQAVRAAYLITRDHALAEDIVQTAFIGWRAVAGCARRADPDDRAEPDDR